MPLTHTQRPIEMKQEIKHEFIFINDFLYYSKKTKMYDIEIQELRHLPSFYCGNFFANNFSFTFRDRAHKKIERKCLNFNK